MIKIRSNVFETNSSSTHSITIDFNYKEKVFKHDKLPNNETIVIANDDVNFQFHSNGNNTTEWTKLNAIVNYILGHYWALGYFYFCKILQTENNYFTILEKIIKDKSNSVVNYNLYDLLDIESITDSNYGHSLVIFGLCEKSTEKENYNCLKQLIFDENVAIKYED